MAIQVKSVGNSPTLQSKSVTPSSSTQIILPDSGYDGLNQITIEKIPEDYIKINKVNFNLEANTGTYEYKDNYWWQPNLFYCWDYYNIDIPFNIDVNNLKYWGASLLGSMTESETNNVIQITNNSTISYVQKYQDNIELLEKLEDWSSGEYVWYPFVCIIKINLATSKISYIHFRFSQTSYNIFTKFLQKKNPCINFQLYFYT